MRSRCPIADLVSCACLALAMPALASEPADPGAVAAFVTDRNGVGVGGATVVLEGPTPLPRTATTDGDGLARFAEVEPGRYAATFSLGEWSLTRNDLVVVSGRTVRVFQTVGEGPTFADSVTVYSASRRRERFVDAPSAVTNLSEAEIERQAASGQLPKLLEFGAGTELTQGGLYEFNLNVRGMNDPFNRRVLTLVDGRDISLPSLGSQEWAAIPFPIDELAAVELVRGPTAALYGANAFNGVLNLLTRAPRHSRGGRARLTAGELDTTRLDVRWAGRVGDGAYLKLTGGYTSSRDFSVARTSGVEYSRPCAFLGDSGCLPLEAIPPRLDEIEIVNAAVRLDKELGEERTLVVEGGSAAFEGPLGVTEFGRLQLTDVERPWARASFSGPRWNVQGSYTGRDGDGQVFLSLGYPFYSASDRLQLDAQRSFTLGEDRGFAVLGASYRDESVDSADPAGRQTVTFRRQEEQFSGVFGQFSWELADSLRGVLALRWDDSSLHDARLSPKASLVWAPASGHTLRLSAGEAFLTPSYVQYFLYLPAAPPVDLSPVEGICAIAGIDCGFGSPLAFRIVGNPDLEPEEIRSLEVGYTATFDAHTLLRVDLFDHRVENFISDFIPYVDPLAGRRHDRYPAWQPPAGLSAELAGLLLTTLQGVLPPELFATLSTGADGEPFFPLLSVINFGRVDLRGVELSLSRSLGRRWSAELGWGHLDFDVEEDLPEDPALPNSPENRASAAVSYLGERLAGSLAYRQVEAFDWSAGVYRGRVPSYGVADLDVGFVIDERWSVGLDVSNLFDDEHFEMFGADLLGRRALAYASFEW